MADHKRNIFIINPAFQYKISLIICLLFLCLGALYPWTIYEVVREIIKEVPDKAAALEGTRNSLIMTLVLLQLGGLGVIFVISIFLTHKIAGPIYKMRKHLQGIRKFEEISNIKFRKGDYFPDLAEDLNLTLDKLGAQRQEDFQYLEEISIYIANLSLVIPDDKKPVLEEIQSKIEKIRSRVP